MIRPAVVLNYIGKIVVIIGIAMMTSVFWSIYYQEEIIWRIVLAAIIVISAASTILQIRICCRYPGMGSGIFFWYLTLFVKRIHAIIRRRNF